MRIITASLTLFIGFTLAACGGHSSPPAAKPADQAGTSEGANPASVYCGEVGGTLEIVDENGGQVGYCTKGDQRCEEWKLFRGECPDFAPGQPQPPAE